MSDRRLRVLYVDDDEGLRRLVSRALQRRGYDVECAASGEEGYARLKAEPYDVVALDHYMPGQGGFATLEAIRRDLRAPPPIVYVTGSEETNVAVAALKAGAADYVVKTVGEDFFDLLQNAFDQAVAQVRLARQAAEADAALRVSHQRLEALLREVNHRVANSLQLVSAFVHMQAAALQDEAARTALKDTQRRIEAIIQVHRRLYTSDDVDTVDMQDYLAGLVSELQDTCSTRESPRRLELNVDPIALHPDKAVSLGVILNELVTNACKYAYPIGAPGEVRIGLNREADGQVLLSIEDDGPGMADQVAPQGTGLGGRLIKVMAGSLGSQVIYESTASGLRATLRVSA